MLKKTALLLVSLACLSRPQRPVQMRSRYLTSLTNTEIEGKARSLMAPVVGDRNAEGVIDFFRRLEEQPSTERLVEYLRKG